ncbi:hypothetical protein ACBJ59_36530 [Nonomuraea sp. MTCD27]|uniref:hypothetical protein n=1 Tax=Nonomuraea sp. MTCD27 TaxID=1676747 RepID=UPI0035C0CC89
MGFMDGPPLATSADLEAYLQRDIPTEQAEVSLRIASAVVRGFTGQQITFVAGDTMVLEGGGSVVVLPQRPVVVDVDNPIEVVELAEYGGGNLDGTDGVTYTRFQDQLQRYCGTWSPRVQVTYSHGYATVPGDVLAAVLDIAGRSLTNPSGLRSVTIDDYSRTYASETFGGASLSEANKLTLANYRRPVSTTRLS